ncbi:MAG: hypothetical protein M5U28_56625 [Sandaracinaceae bacterium]|nr:hypothetical protein [Sandaracinaceae bacterium]
MSEDPPSSRRTSAASPCASSRRPSPPLRCCGSGIAPRAVADALFEVGVLAPMSAPELAACLEAVAEVEAAPAAMILAHASAARVLEQLAQGPRIGERELLGSPLYEEPAGRPAMLRCRARPRGLELDGHAELIVGAPLADWLLVRARTDEGVALVLARASGEGVHVGEPVETLGMRGCP